MQRYDTYEEKKKTMYHDMLRDDIREILSISSCMTMEDMISRAREWDIELEYLGKRMTYQVQTVGGPVKRP